MNWESPQTPMPDWRPRPSALREWLSRIRSGASAALRSSDAILGLVVAFVGLALIVYASSEPGGFFGARQQQVPLAQFADGTPGAGTPFAGPVTTVTSSPSPATPTSTVEPSGPTPTQVIGTPEPPFVPQPPSDFVEAPATDGVSPGGGEPSSGGKPFIGKGDIESPPVPTSTPTETLTPTPTPTPTVTPTPTMTPTPTVQPRFNDQGMSWLSSCEVTVIRVYLKDRNGSPVNGQKFRISTQDGSWSGEADPTGKAGRFEPGWTGFQLAEGPKAGTWALWPADDAGIPLSPPVLFETTDIDCQPGGSGKQVGTSFWVKNY